MEPYMLAWAAGIVDGEGTICIERRKHVKRDGSIGYQYIPKVSVANTHKPTIERFILLFDGHPSGWRRDAKSRKNKNWSDCFCAEWSSKRAKDVISKLLPFLFTKLEQAKIVLSLPMGQQGGRPRWYPEEFEIIRTQQADAYQKVRLLNKRPKFQPKGKQ